MTSGVAPEELHRLSALPTSVSPWELAVSDAPRSWDPAGLFQMLIVAEAGLLRCLRPVVDDADTLAGIVGAIRGDDQLIRPARPSLVVVDTDATADRIRTWLEPLGTRVQVRRELPLVQHVLAEMDRRPQPLSKGTLTGAGLLQRPLTEAVARLVDLEPWRFLPKEMPLELALPGEASHLLMCFKDEPPIGVDLWPSDDQGMPPGVARAGPSLMLRLAPARAVPREVRVAFDRHRLAVSNGAYPRFMGSGTVADQPSLTEAEERTLLATLDAACQFLEDHRARLPDLTGLFSAPVTIAESQGTVTVRYDLYARARELEATASGGSSPALEALPTLALSLSLQRAPLNRLGGSGEHEVVAFVLSGSRAALQDVAPLVQQIESLSLATLPDGDYLVAHGQAGALGIFAKLPPKKLDDLLVDDPPPSDWPAVVVLVTGRRRKLSDPRAQASIVAQRSVALRRLDP